MLFTSKFLKKPRLFTGITPTGSLTFGHYCGVINFLLEKQNEYEIVIMIADLHALTIYTPGQEEIYKKSEEISCLLYSCGLKKENCKIFLQSQISEHPELACLISPFITVGKLSDMIQYKEKKQKENVTGNLLLFSYPVLMAADVILYDADLVVIGEDQRQHSEIIKKLFKSLNSLFPKLLLRIPEFVFPELGSKILDLKDPRKKMSKSNLNSLYLTDLPQSIDKKIMGAQTDSENNIFFNLKTKPGISNLLIIYSVLNGASVIETEKKFREKDYFYLKTKLADLVKKKVSEIKQKQSLLISEMWRILEENTKRLRKDAKKKVFSFKKELRLIP